MLKKTNISINLFQPSTMAGFYDLKVDLERCWNHNTKTGSCNDCATVCPVDAIDINPELKLNFSKCVYCGLCVNTCETGALQFPKFYENYFLSSLKSWQNSLSPNEDADEYEIVLTCPSVIKQHDKKKKSKQKESTICLAALDEAHYMLLLRTVTGNLTLDCSLCQTCEYSRGEELIRNRVNQVNAWSQALDMKGEVEISTDSSNNKKNQPHQWIVQDKTVNRRSFFTSSFKKGMVTAATQLEIVDDQETEETSKTYFETPNKRKLLQSLCFESNRLEEIPAKPEDLPVLSLEVRGGCSFCGECFTSCPSNAIDQIDDFVESKLVFNPLKCLGCSHCETLCPDGLIITKKLDHHDFQLESKMLIQQKKQACDQCERPFLAQPGVVTCPACIKHKSLDQEMMQVLNW